MKTFSMLLTLLVALDSGAQQKEDLNNVEWHIQTATISAGTDSAKALSRLVDSLYSINCETCAWLNYWKANAGYRLAQYHLSRDESESERQVSKAIDLLESVPEKTSDEYALLGSLISLSINFNSGMAANLSSKSREYFTRAIALDKNNPRAYYGFARSDYYRPKQYGGGQVAEEYLLKALSLPFKSSSSPLAPSWGKEESYLLLINFYLREARKEDALLFYNRARKEFPHSSELKSLQSKFLP